MLVGKIPFSALVEKLGGFASPLNFISELQGSLNFASAVAKPPGRQAPVQQDYTPRWRG
jgi:hypothetical protein